VSDATMSQHFFVKLIPHRSTFAQDMTADEREVMIRHGAYWTGLMHKGVVPVFGPVMDPAGAYGIGILEADDEAALRSLLENDPAVGLNRYEVHPMRAVHPGQHKDSA
jgi:uncharacterized protein YciI